MSLLLTLDIRSSIYDVLCEFTIDNLRYTDLSMATQHFQVFVLFMEPGGVNGVIASFGFAFRVLEVKMEDMGYTINGFSLEV